METTYAYLAGAIDSDGYITIYRSTPKPGRADGSINTYYGVKLGLSQVDTRIADLLHQTFGGYRGHHTPKNPAHLPWHIWSVTNQSVIPILQALLPHLRMKGEQARLCIELAERIKATKGGHPRSLQEMAERQRLWAAVTRLNRPRNRRVHHLEIDATPAHRQVLGHPAYVGESATA